MAVPSFGLWDISRDPYKKKKQNIATCKWWFPTLFWC